MKIQDLKPPVGAHKSRNRVGRGNSAGQGTTCGRGTKGQKARSGARIPAWFEGGQMPLQRRVPKRGFNRKRFKTTVQIVDVSDLDRHADETVFDRGRMASLGLIDPDAGPVKVLASGTIARAVEVTAESFSAGARRAIEQAGGKVETGERKN